MISYLINVLVLAATVYFGFASINGISGPDSFTTQSEITALLVIRLWCLFAKFISSLISFLIATVTSVITLDRKSVV